MLSKLPRFTLTACCLLAILCACLIDFSGITPEAPAIAGLDKMVHGAMYFVLAAVFIWEFRGRSARLFDRTDKMMFLFWTVFIGSALFGLAVEELQGLTTYRSKEGADLSADIFGALAAYFIYYLISLTRINRNSEQ